MRLPSLQAVVLVAAALTPSSLELSPTLSQTVWLLKLHQYHEDGHAAPGAETVCSEKPIEEGMLGAR